MKKWLISILLSFLLISLVCAQETATSATAETAKIAANANQNFQTSSNAFLESDITIPENLDLFAKVLFGLEESNTIDLSGLIILLALWIIILLILKSIMELIPLFEEGWKAWLGAIVVTCLISTTGSIRDAAVFWFDMRKLFGALGNYSFFFVALDVIILALFAWGARKVIHRLGFQGEKTEEEIMGAMAGATAAMAKTNLNSK